MKRDLAITFAGGGSRAFYQIGLMEEWAEHLLPRTASVAGCSAGAAMATLLLSGRVAESKRFFAERRKGVRGHIDLRRMMSGRRPFPHDDIYRATLMHALSDGGLERVQESPFPVRIIASAMPRFMPSPVGIALGLGVYQFEKRMNPQMLHPTLPRKVGFVAHAWDARECETAEQLVELVISSSSTPPFTKRGRFERRLLLDGSLIDNAPAFLAEESPDVVRNLVLLTRPYPESVTGRKGHRLYIAPAAPLPIKRWDYREHAPVEETLEIGRQDGRRHRAALEHFLDSTVSPGLA